MANTKIFKIVRLTPKAIYDPVIYARIRRTSQAVIAANIQKDGYEFADARLIQECAELIQAITNDQLDIPEKANVIEELADVMYMIDVYCRIHSISYGELNDRMAQKETRAMNKLGLTVDRSEAGCPYE